MRTSEPRFLARILAPITEVRPGEAVTALLLALNVFLLLTAYYLIKPVREALILSLESGAEFKAYLSGAIAVTLIFAVPAYARLVDRWSRIVLLVVVTLSFAVELVLFYAASQVVALRPYLAYVFYVWVGVFNMMVVAQFFSYANDLYNLDQGKRLLPLVVLGSSIGATVGSKIAGLLIPALGVFAMLLIAALLLCACAFLFWMVERREVTREAAGEVQPAADRHGAFQLVLGHRYLLLIAGFSLVFTCVNSNGEYILGKLVAAEGATKAGAAKGEYIGAFYAEFFFYVNLAGLLVQSFLVSRLVRWFGFGAMFLVLPVLALGNAVVIAALPLLAVVRVAKIAENALDYSLNNSLRQMLWLVTSREMKYKAKQAVDTFFVRMGDVLGALVVGASVLLFGGNVQMFAGVNAAFALIWLVLAILIGREHARRLHAHERDAPAATGEAARATTAG